MTAPQGPNAGIGVLVHDEHGAEAIVLLFPAGEIGRIATTMHQQHDDQRALHLRLTLDGQPLETVSIELPARPRGEEVQVRICLDEIGILDVELQHEDVLVERIIRYG